MTWACLLTPPGRGAIAVIQTTRDPAEFTGPLPERPGMRRFVASGSLLDEVVARRTTAMTGEPAWEICCHGGPGPVDAILQALGAPVLTADALVARARELGAIDEIQERAYRSLPRALTRRGAEVLLDQIHGALSKALREGRDMAETAPFGIALTSPPRVAIVGRPNAGKSTLLNAFARRERALVSAEPGTTRDPVEECVAVDGVPLRMVDTAGVRATDDPLERWSVERAREEAASSDAVIHVIDATDPRPDPELESLPRRTAVRNKVDLAGGEGICAKTGDRVEELGRAVLRALAIRTDWPPGAPIVFDRVLLDRR